MKIIILTLAILSSSIGHAKTICTMTFNSSDEKRVFQNELKNYSHKFIELIPENKDPNWLENSCEKLEANGEQCDSLLISGHFGGIFFGESKSTTISLSELFKLKQEKKCASIYEKVQSVFLMGCNTLSGKTPDHRSVDDYLRVLVRDGFPLVLAESVAASRYLSFGQSMSEKMQMIFNNADMIVGFESTGPLGSTAAPLLSRAFQQSSNQTKFNELLSKETLLSAFKSKNIRIVRPSSTSTSENDLLNQALSVNSNLATTAWYRILESTNVVRYFDFIINNKYNLILKSILEQNIEKRTSTFQSLNVIYNKSGSLASIKQQVNHFFIDNKMIALNDFIKRQTQIIEKIVSEQIDYVRAEQICNIFELNKKYNLLNHIDQYSYDRITRSRFSNFMLQCAGITNLRSDQKASSKSMKCLVNKESHDWNCLTENQNDLDINSCKLAKSRNSDAENSDDMLWYCYSKMRDSGKLNAPLCLELAHNFSLLGNKIKMNWNCQNKIYQ